MVYTRQMTLGNNGTGEAIEHNSTEYISARLTRNSIAATAASSSNQGQCSSSGSSSSSTSKRSPAAPVQSLELPQEIYEKIFGYLSFKNICQLRFVCTRFDRICGNILNTTFQRLQHQLLERFQDIKRRMPRRESARRNHHLACESDIIETLHMRLTLLQMSFGKHIERKHCCFFPGEILDEVYHILHYIKVTPKLARPYKVTDEFFDLSTMAMEYFKDKIEPDLPEIAYFSTDFLDFSSTFPSTSKNNFLCIDTFSLDMDETKDRNSPVLEPPPSESSVEVTPQSNIVLRKGIRKIKQGMKKYNSQLSILRQDVRTCRQKAAEQQRLMSEQQKQLAEQQKQILEYAARMDENEKKNEEISRKFSTLLQELNKCKTELQYWRSKSPAVPPFCTSCGSAVVSYSDELKILANQGINPEPLEIERSESVTLPEFIDEPQKSPEIRTMEPEPKVEKVVTTAEENYVPTKKRKIDETKCGSGGGSSSSSSSSTSGYAINKVIGQAKRSRKVLKGRNRKSKV